MCSSTASSAARRDRKSGVYFRSNNAGDDARRMGRVQPVAGADGNQDAGRARIDGCARLPRRARRGEIGRAACISDLTMRVTMRGEWGEFNPWQVPMGTKTQAALELMDVLVYRVERGEEAGETVAGAFDIAFNGSLATAVLLSQRLIGAKRWVK